MSNIWKDKNTEVKLYDEVMALIGKHIYSGYFDELDTEDNELVFIIHLNDYKYNKNDVTKWCYEEDLIKQAMEQ